MATKDITDAEVCRAVADYQASHLEGWPYELHGLSDCYLASSQWVGLFRFLDAKVKEESHDST